jgi:hypothetical protein
MINNERRNFLHKSTMLAASGVLTACGGGADNAAAADPAAVAAVHTEIAATNVTVPTGTALPNAVIRLAGASTVKAAPYCLGFAFRRGDVPAGSAVTADTGTIQVTPKNVWPDGSLKFAVIAGQADLAAGVDTKVGLMIIPQASTTPTPLKTAKLRATEIVAEIGCGAYGTVKWGGADWDAPFDTWVSGAAMSSWIYRKPVGTDKHLVAWLEVRLWPSGAVEVLPWIENGYLKVAGPINKSATFTFTLGKTQRMSAAIDLKHHQRTPLVTGTALSYWLGTAPGVTPMQDVAYMQASELVPTYSAAVPPGGGRMRLQATSFTPLQQGGFNYDNDSMPSPGYQTAIGLLPEHDVLHLVAAASDRIMTYGSVVRNGYSAGRYGLHYRDENTNRPPAFSSYPTLVFADNSGFKDTGASTTSSYTPAPTGGNAPTWDTSHSPSVGYMAYLLTGRFYFKEEVQFAAISNHFNVTDWVRGGGRSGVYKPAPGFTNASGICVTNVQTRAGAWWFRTLSQALAVTPDAGDPLRAELIATVEANCNYYHKIYIAQPNNPFGMVEEPYTTYGDIPGKVTIPVWQQDFFTAAWGMALSLDLPISAAARAKMVAFFAWKAKSVVGRLGPSTGWHYINAAPYTMPISPSIPADYYGGTGPWLTDFKAAYDVMVASYVDTGNGPLSKTEGVLGMDFPAASQPSMWHNLQPALAYAVRHGVDGAQAGYDRMRSASNWSAISEVFNSKPVWSVKPAGAIPAAPVIVAPVQPVPTPVGAPAWLAGRALNEWREIPGTSGAGGASIEEYSGWARVNNQLVAAACGGHHLSDNRVVSIDLGADAPVWVVRMAASTSVQGDVPRNADGKPTSRHIYHMAKYVPALDRVLLLGARFTYSEISTGSFLTVDGFNLNNNTWDPAATYPNVPTLNGGAVIDGNGDAWATTATPAKFSAATRSWSSPVTTIAAKPVRYPWALDSKRNQLFGLCYGAGEGGDPVPAVNAVKQAGNIQTQITFNPSAALTQFIADAPFNAGMDYDPINDFFLFYSGFVAGRMYKIIPNAGNVWDMQVFAYGAGNVTPAPSVAGTLSRFSYMPALKGFVLLPGRMSNLVFMRTA